jgi:hypothetical protein
MSATEGTSGAAPATSVEVRERLVEVLSGSGAGTSDKGLSAPFSHLSRKRETRRRPPPTRRPHAAQRSASDEYPRIRRAMMSWLICCVPS